VTSGTVVGTVVVAIGISLKLLPIDYNKARLAVEAKICASTSSYHCYLDERNVPGVAAKTKPADSCLLGI